MANLLNVPCSDNWDGVSYAKTITEGVESGHDGLVISQMAHVCQRSTRFGDWLYMRTYHDGFHLFDKEMLYNKKAPMRRMMLRISTRKSVRRVLRSSWIGMTSRC